MIGVSMRVTPIRLLLPPLSPTGFGNLLVEDAKEKSADVRTSFEAPGYLDERRERCLSHVFRALRAQACAACSA